MNAVSPRSLQLLHDIVSEGEQDDLDLGVDAQTDKEGRLGNMSVSQEKDYKDTLNFFEKLEQENKPVENGDVNGYENSHLENNEEEHLDQIAEDSGEESYTVTEVSETTEDNSNYDNNRVFTKKRVQIRHPKQTKASSLRENSTDRDSVTETMSDSGQVGRQQRKLNKRAQMRAFKYLGIERLETAEVKLERKYQELEDLLSNQFSEQKNALSLNHVQQMELLRQQYAIASHGLPPTGVLVPRSMPAQFRGRNRRMPVDKENVQHPASEDEAYTTIRTLQATKHPQRRSRARSARTRPLSATRQNQSRSTSRDQTDRDVSNRLKQNSPDRDSDHERNVSKDRSRSNSRTRSRSGSSSGSPRRMYIMTETHLKNTDNELVKEWIKRKDIEYRRKKAEERRKKKLERQKKIEDQIEKEEKYRDSQKIVLQWMKQKKREATRKQKHERDELKEEAAKRAHERAKKVAGIHGWGVDNHVAVPAPIYTDRSKIRARRPISAHADLSTVVYTDRTTDRNTDRTTERKVRAPRPRTADVRRDRNMIRVSRPGTTEAEVQELREQREREMQQKEDEMSDDYQEDAVIDDEVNEESIVTEESNVTEESKVPLQHQEIPQPPETKYVYKRPVLGKVRLRVKTPDSSEQTSPKPQKKKVQPKKESKEDLEKKQRVSYDDWLVQKRKEDAEELKEKQKLAKSQQERERPPLPDLGDNNVLRGRGIPGVSCPQRPQYVSKIISEEERERIREMAVAKKIVKKTLEEEFEAGYDSQNESEEEAIDRVAKNIVEYIIRCVTDDDEDEEEEVPEDEDEDADYEAPLERLKIQGSRAPLSSKTRPMSASSAYTAGPTVSKSPRRPVSAHPKGRQASEEIVQQVQGSVPFPPDVGAPGEIMRIQKKLFGEQMWVNPEDGERPEPQGSDINESESTEFEDNAQKEKNANFLSDPSTESLSGSKKRVSFCEQPIVFDDSKYIEEEVSEEINEDWGDVDDLGQDDSDLEKARNLILNVDENQDGGFFLTSSPEQAQAVES